MSLKLVGGVVSSPLVGITEVLRRVVDIETVEKERGLVVRLVIFGPDLIHAGCAA
jgi:hypothetical protein